MVGKSAAGDDDTYYTVELLTECLTAEVDEYSKWASGEVFGFIITDRNGDTVDSCWGFIGLDYAIQAAKDAVPDEPQPEKLYSVRLTADQMARLGLELGD